MSLGLIGIKRGQTKYLGEDGIAIPVTIVECQKNTVCQIKNEKIEREILDEKKYSLLKENEEFILSVTDKGFGKRSSSYEYRKTSRGGVGIANMQLTERNGNEVVASFPITDKDQLMLVTDKGKLIRCPVNDIRIAGRQTQGVTLFNVSNDERVVSVAKLEENE